jgi:hypothetical protein
MSTNRYDYFETVWNDDIQHDQKGFINNDLINNIKASSFIYYKIPLAYRYRPDLIAKKFYGSGKYHWILIYANDINDSPQGFSTDTIIKIPSPGIIGNLI